MTWVRRILVALPFAAPVTLTVLIIFADRLTCVSNVLPDSGSCYAVGLALGPRLVPECSEPMGTVVDRLCDSPLDSSAPLFGISMVVAARN
jgi:hypothetical protein